MIRIHSNSSWSAIRTSVLVLRPDARGNRYHVPPITLAFEDRGWTTHFLSETIRRRGVAYNRQPTHPDIRDCAPFIAALSR
jgi:hypothetical protein